ncbi:MAG: hypothetical protein ABSD20_20305 [Terriglobales bacterium]|jgi:hypothetical protein
MRLDAASGLAAVRVEVEGACQSLVMASPEALTRCEGALQRAATALRQGHAAWDWKSAGKAARIEAAQLQVAIRRAGRLLSNTSRYHAGWLRVLSAMTGGYSARGEAAAMPGMRRISLEG